MAVAGDWWRTFFSGAAVDFWLRATSEEQTRREADFIQEMLGVKEGAQILDVPCGGGRHSVELARRGLVMTGVDISEDFLRAARGSSAGKSLAVRWEQRDMRDLPWAGQFDGAFCFGNSFGYYDEQGNADFLKAVSATLKPGGRLVLDTSYVMEILLPSLQERVWFPMGDLLFLADRRYVPATSRLEVEYTWIRDGQQDRRAMSARLYSYREVCGLLEEAGLGEIQGFASLEKETFQLGSKRLLLAARKPG